MCVCVERGRERWCEERIGDIERLRASYYFMHPNLLFSRSMAVTRNSTSWQ